MLLREADTYIEPIKKNSIGVADGILRGTFLEYATGCKCGGEDSGEQKKIGQ